MAQSLYSVALVRSLERQGEKLGREASEVAERAAAFRRMHMHASAAALEAKSDRLGAAASWAFDRAFAIVGEAST